jgi:WD40 repeat protein/serine/threonine protein kinase/lipopolysaccharide biosynthesis regulator YciM
MNSPSMVEDIFLAAVGKNSPQERVAYLDSVCQGDEDLRRRVERLLAAHPQVGDFLEKEPIPFGQTVDSTPGNEDKPAFVFEGTTEFRPDSAAGMIIAGRYTLIEKIGEGGMGEVWVAKQTEPVKRKVALKLIKVGMDSKAVLQRFEQERQALALMDHPNIAKVLDGGMIDRSPLAGPDAPRADREGFLGRPFFVMELVNGLPLTKFCDDAKLGIRERLELFTSGCQAVQHAHQKGIIHRDLKPANILVTIIDGKGVPKVIDFGVAKATSGRLTEESLSTQFGAVVGTLEYMSPEQAGFAGEDIDTRADIYSLGVILYELLTGLRPIDAKRLKKAAFTEMIRIIKEEEPSKPSTRLSTDASAPSMAALRQMEPKKLRTLLRGELDWVVMKCLEKQRDRRYETANGLARDIQRYLADEVVEARPPSLGYRASKFVRRHKGQVTAASLVAFALVGGIVGTSLGWFEARRQTQEKEQARQAEADRVTERDEALGKRDYALKQEALRLKERDKANDELRHRLGVNAMVLANAAYDNRDFKLAAERLDNVPVDRRGWEWHYLKRQLNGGIFTLYGHSGPVTSVAFSPEGTRIVTGGGDQSTPFEAKVWDARTGLHLFDLQGLPANVRRGWGNVVVVCLAFSPDGKRILSAGGEKTVRVFDATTGAVQLELDKHVGHVCCAAFSPDGTQIATAFRVGNFALVRLWDARTGKALLDWKAHQYYVERMMFSPDGTRLLTGGGDQAVKVWDVRTGKLLLGVNGIMMQYEIGGLAFSPDGKRILAGGNDGAARVIDARTGALLHKVKGRPRVSHAFSSTASGVLSAAFSPDGSRFVTGGSTGGFGTGEASIRDARTGAELLELKGHTGIVMSVAFSPDGERIITGSTDGTAKVWDARTGTPRLELAGTKSAVASAAFSPDGAWMVTGGGDGATKVWDARTGIPRLALKGIEGRVLSVAVSKDGKRIVTGGGNIPEPGQWRSLGDFFEIGGAREKPKPGKATVWDARTGRALVELKGLREPVNSVAFSPDGRRIITAGARWENSGGGELKVWDASAGTVLIDLSHRDHPGTAAGERGGSVAFSRDGTRFLTGSVRLNQGMPVKVWDAGTATVKVETPGITSPVRGVAFSPDGGRFATANYDKTATVRNAKSGTVIADMKGHTGNLNCVAFSPDGKRIVTGSGDSTVRVWDVRTGTTLAELKGHTGAVSSVSFSADGTRILSTGGAYGKPGEVFVWDAPVAAEVDLVGHTGFVQGIAFTPDSKRIATASQDKTVKFWDPRTGNPLGELKDFQGGVSLLAFSPDGKRIATDGNGPEVTVWDVTTKAKLADLKAGYLKRVAFSIDGMRIVTEGHDNATKVWDARSGQELKGDAIPKTVAGERTSPDGRLLARPIQNRVLVVPLVPDAEAIASRRAHKQSNPSRYRTGYLAARAAKDDFAAAFYLNLIPANQRKAVIEQADADAFAAMCKLADEYQLAGKQGEAVPLLIEILKVNKARRGSDAPKTIEAADTLGRIYYQSGQYEKAIRPLEDVLKHRKAKRDPRTPNAMGMLGLAYKEAGRLKEAIAVLEEGAAKDRWVRQHLLDAYALAGEHAKVVNLCQKQLAGPGKKKPDKTYAQADLLARLGRAYLAQKKWSEAEPAARECLAIFEKTGPESWTVSNAQSLVGGSLLGQKKYAEAEPLLLKGYEGLKQWEKALEPPDAPRLPETLDRLIDLYTAMNKPDEAKKWRAERAKYLTKPAPKEPKK